MKTEIRLATSDYSSAESQTVSTHPPGEGGGGDGVGGGGGGGRRGGGDVAGVI